MSRIDELIAQHCPGGVEVKTLGELLGNIPRGRRLTRSSLAADGSIPVFHGGLEPIGFHNQANTPGKTVMIINTGASSGFVGWSEVAFWCSDGCFALPHSEAVLSRYLYYYAVANGKFFIDRVRRAGIPTLAADSILAMRIPVPPIVVQREIVEILDLFTRLEAELEAELEARKKQYAIALSGALSFEHSTVADQGPVESLFLGELESAGVIQLGRGQVISKHDLAAKPGTYPVYSSSAAGTGLFGTYGEYMFEDERITWSVDGGGKFFFREPHRYSVTNVSGWLKVLKPDYIRTKFLFYSLSNSWSTKVFDYTKKAHPSVVRKEFEVQVPRIDVQDAIVESLDALSDLIQNVSTGLPAEISARRKQYEYYRDKFLTFEEKVA